MILVACYIELRMPIGYYTAVYISRSIEEPIVTGCIYRLDQGNYTIDIYDIKHNGVKDTDIALTLYDIVVSFTSVLSTYTTSSTASNVTELTDTISREL